MDEATTGLCGYTYPEEFDAESPKGPVQQNCCVRDSLPDTVRCEYHADPEKTEHKLKQLKDNDSTSDSLDGAVLPGEFVDNVNLDNVRLLRDTDLSGADLSGTNLSHANLSNADLSEAYLGYADLSEANLMSANLSEANLREADLSEVLMTGADLSGVNMSPAPNGEGTNLSEGNLADTNLSGAFMKQVDLSGADLDYANLSEADLRKADLSEADLRRATLSEAILSAANLSEANLERATMVEVNLFDANLTKITPYGARIEAVQINDGTDFYKDKKEYSRWWQREGTVLAASPRCGYDPAVEQPEQAADETHEELLTKAADTYRQFEELARRNTQPSLQSSMFVLRQDMQRERYRERGQYSQWFANRVFRIVFKHGESFSRILLTAAAIILLFAGVYWQADLIINNPDAVAQNQEFIDNPLDAVYFSTLTFTTLGLGDFQPAAASQLGRGLVLLEAALGAILIATFVFVLGRRAAR